MLIVKADLTRKNVVDLTPGEVERLRELTFRSDGYMEEEFLDAIYGEQQYKPYRYTQALMARVEGQIVGWSLLQPVHRSPRYLAYFYVDPRFRKQGIGGQLINYIKWWSGYAPQVCKGYTNEGFFDKFPHTTQRMK